MRIYPIAASDLRFVVKAEKPTENSKIGAVETARYREPKQGEWFISGAIPEAYQAPNDLSTKYQIAELVWYENVPICTVE